jgi:hypothetical protein
MGMGMPFAYHIMVAIEWPFSSNVLLLLLTTWINIKFKGFNQMPQENVNLSSLKLSVEDRELVAQAAGDLIAVQVYREFQKAAELTTTAGGSTTAGHLIGNCSCSSKNVLLDK